ncbi:MAG TPA: T9SS type A sorting domain-containing protein [Bacteroidia bacterium]|nr:T9SS type A sorting domain-containing protein [Bacteroidia bacterium]
MKKFSALLSMVILFAATAFAQDYLNQPNLHNRPADKKATFWDIQKAFETAWDGRTPSDTESENEEGGGWQQFKRWEWFAEQRTYPSGNFPDPGILFDQYRVYKTQYANQNARSASASWSFIGPHVVPGNGGGAGRINCITFDPNNSNIIWIGSACGGLWKSTDGGATWSSNTDLLPSLSISDIVIDPTNTQTMYIATGDKYGIYWQYETWGHYSAGILKSTDGGNTWNPTTMNYSLANVVVIQRLIMDPSNTSVLFAATNAGIFKTTDAGVTWNNIRSGKYYDIEFNPGNDNIVYAGDSTGFLRTTDAGVTWNYISGVTSGGRTSIAVTPANNNAVYVWCENGGNVFTLYYSSNAGVSFSQKTDPSPNCTPYGYYDMVIEASPANANVLFAGGLDIARSTDGGTTWNTVSDWAGWPNTNYCHADNHAQKFLPGSSNTIFSCNDGGIFKSTDQGNTWNDLSGGIDIKQYYRMSSSFLTPSLMYAGAQDNGTDRITGLSAATQVNGADGQTCLVDYTNDNVVFVSSQGGYFLKSTDGGNTFNALTSFGCDWTSPLVMDPVDNNIMYMGSSDVLKSTDNGNTWNNISNGYFDGSCVYSLVVSPANTNYIYAATFGNIYRTTNGGNTWTTITGTLPVGSAAITGISVSDNNPDALWVTFSGFSPGNKVFYSSDGGASWGNVSGTLPNIPVNCTVYQNGSNDIVYIGTDLGVFYTDATLNDWQPYNTGLPNVIVDQLEINYPTSKLRAATYGRGIWESDLQVSTLVNLDASVFAMNSPPSTTCDTSIVPVLRIRNAGMDTIFNVELHYRMDNLAWQQYNWNGTLASLGTANIVLPLYTLSPGTHTLKAYTASPNSGADQNAQNDTLVRTFTILSSSPPSTTAPPVSEGFVSSTFPPANWTMENSSGLWSRNTTYGGYGLSSQSAMADFYYISSGTDMIVTQYVDFTNAVAPITLWFDVAYAQYDVAYNDSLIVDLYSDCPGIGERVYARSGSALATAPMTQTVFAPLSNQWRTDTIHLDSLAGRGPMEIRFIAKSGYGNELYLDNINLNGNALGIYSQSEQDGLDVYPNPANGTMNVVISAAQEGSTAISIYDLTGNAVYVSSQRTASGENTIPVDVSGLAQGVYLLRVETDGKTTSRLISVSR